MDGGAWWAAVHEVAKSQTQLSDFTFHFPLSCIGEGNGNPPQYSCLENPVDRGAWRAAVHRVAQSQTRLRLSMHACIGEGNGNPLQYSWRTPGTEVSGGLLSMGLHRVGHD